MIYTSDNSGKSWVPRSDYGGWTSIASSGDGNKLVAAGGGSLHTSADSGKTWVQRASLPRVAVVASSSDGNKLVATGTYPIT